MKIFIYKKLLYLRTRVNENNIIITYLFIQVLNINSNLFKYLIITLIVNLSSLHCY